MEQRAEIAYMQARIARMASEKWNVPISTIGLLFGEYKVFEHIKNCYGLFHVEGDEAVWEDLIPYLKNKGCPYA